VRSSQKRRGFSSPYKNIFKNFQEIICCEFYCGMKNIPPLNFPYPVFSTSRLSTPRCDGQLNLCRSQHHQLSSVDIDSYHVLTPVDVACATVCYCRTLYTPCYTCYA